MLRLRIDLTAFDAKAKGTFWRLERDGILQETVEKYATHLLREYGITGVKPQTFLDGTFLPEAESPLILRDGDLLRILPGKVLETHLSIADWRNTETMSTTVSNGTAAIENEFQSHVNGITTNGQPQETGTIECAVESACASQVFETEDISDGVECSLRKRKRGKRSSRVRTKRVSFDVLGDENGQPHSPQQMQSTPFKKRSTADIIEETQNGSSVETRSEAYMTALDATPGISRLSRTPMKTASARKNKKLQSGVGYYLSLLGSEDSSAMAPSYETSDATPASNHLSPGPSNLEQSQLEGESSPTLPEKSLRETSLLSTLEPNLRISCDIGMFDVKTSAVEFYPGVTLEIVDNNRKKKCVTVRHIEGPSPPHISGTEFKVDWGMLSSVKKL